ncbi:general transcription factor 3C polypeptide 3-like [Babylonia areolata]|uniref:general transcription factor 3C polypeptide 3-like n=1 Tax=Babylonia areolata TaxID=304850 RepID=UPI003FD06897
MAEEPNRLSLETSETNILRSAGRNNDADSTCCAEERRTLFRFLEGEVTDEQLEAWNQMTAQTSRLVVHSSQSETHSETLASPTGGMVTSLSDCAQGIPAHDSGPATITALHPPPADWNLLDPDAEMSGEQEQDVHEDRIDSVLDLADAAKRVSAISRMKEQSTIDEEDFSSMALNTPEVLTTYLTGKLTFGEFFKAVDDARKTRLSEKRIRKRKADGEFVYGDDDEDLEQEEEELVEEEREDTLWLPDTKSAEDSGQRRKPRKPRRKKWELPKDLLGLMGETNNQMARGNYEEAIDMCLELIRRAPNASQPYDTLAMLYDEQGLTKKATEVLLMSAYLRRTDSDLWVSVTKRLLEQNEPRKAVQCLTQAIRFGENKMELMQEKCLLYEELGEMPKALIGYTQMLNYIDPGPEHDEKYLALARKLCETYHNMKRTNDAARVLTNMFKARPSLINSDDMNKLLDLRMTMKQYQACLEGLVDYCGVEASLSDGREWSQSHPLPADCDLKAMPGTIISVTVPDNLPQGFPLDLLTKLCSCLINLNFVEQAKHLVETLLKEDVEEDGNGERFLDVADAYMEVDRCTEALPILERCVHSHNYSQAAVWLRYGECLSAVGHLMEAVEAFSKVVELAPNHLGARVSLSALQQQIGRHDEALQVLSGTSGGDTGEVNMEDQTLLLHKCHLLFSQKRNTEFITASRRLLFHYFHENHKTVYSKIVFGYRSMRHRKDALKVYMEKTMRGDAQGGSDKDTESKKDKASDSEKKKSKVNADDLWDLYIKLCNILLEEGKMEELSEVALLGLTCPAFTGDAIKNRRAEFLCLTVCLMTKNGHFAYNFIKEMCLKDPDNKMAWNLFNQSLIYSNEIRHHKFCLRRLLQWPDHLVLGVLNGHNSVQNGSYRCALGEYMSVFQRTPTDPLISLCIGLCYFHICCQKFTNRKDWLVLEGIAYMNTYLDLRGRCQESYYNLGRAMQQLDLGYAAVYYYKKALSLPPVVQDKDGALDLTKEIAFNLSLIYRRSGNPDLARLCLQTYVVL